MSGGSFGLFRQAVNVQQRFGKVTLNVAQSWQQSDGYRENSAMKRYYTHVHAQWNYRENGMLKLLLLLSDLQYRTPGGLNMEQFAEEPRQARPATATLPGATIQKAGVYNRSLFAGISNDVLLGARARQVTSLFVSATGFRNPFITNYEQRKEHGFGFRAHLDIHLRDTGKIITRWTAGGEGQWHFSDIRNYGNRLGSPDTLQASDKISTLQSFVFTRFVVDLDRKLLIEASASYNFFHYRFRNFHPFPEPGYTRRNFQPQLMPRVAFSLRLSRQLAFRGSASGGYSPPTTAEVRASDNIINTSLEAEKGYNTEAGFRWGDEQHRIWVDISAFYFRLSNAIVRRLHPDGNEFFINAGATEQPGLEAQAGIWALQPQQAGMLRAVQVRTGLTWNRFRFRHYMVNAADY